MRKDQMHTVTAVAGILTGAVFAWVAFRSAERTTQALTDSLKGVSDAIDRTSEQLGRNIKP